MTAELNGLEIKSREALHNALTRALSLPDWYGRNLDALHDCLTDLSEETELRLTHMSDLRTALGAYADAFLAVLRETENPFLRVTVEE